MSEKYQTHYPAHESLQEFARRLCLSEAAAYAEWHNRPYAEVRVNLGNEDHASDYLKAIVRGGVSVWPARGPGLGLLLSDLGPARHLR